MLKAAVVRDNDNPFAWYQLGVIYESEGDEGRAALATAERSSLEDNPKRRCASAKLAMRGIPAGTSGLASRAGHRHGVEDSSSRRQDGGDR